MVQCMGSGAMDLSITMEGLKNIILTTHPLRFNSCEISDILALNPPTQADDLFKSLKLGRASSSWCSSYENYCKYDAKVLQLQTLAERDNLHSDYAITCDLIYLTTPVYKGTLDLSTHEAHKIRTIYNYIYSSITISYFLPFYLSSKKCIMAGELLLSGSIITAFWPVESHNLSIDGKPQVGCIIKFMKHPIKISVSNQIIDKTHIVISSNGMSNTRMKIIIRAQNSGLLQAIFQPISVYDLAKSNLVGQIYCTFPVGKPTKTCAYFKE